MLVLSWTYARLYRWVRRDIRWGLHVYGFVEYVRVAARRAEQPRLLPADGRPELFSRRDQLRLAAHLRRQRHGRCTAGRAVLTSSALSSRRDQSEQNENLIPTIYQLRRESSLRFTLLLYAFDCTKCSET